jgi:fibronectin-binding autotransporter adhesin
MRTHHFNPSNRQPCWRTNRLAWLVTLLCGLPTAAQALVQIWTGAVNGNWSEGGNWQSGSPPSDLDDLVFPAGEARDDTTNNLAGRTFNSITFSRGRYELYGNTITLLKGIGAGNVDFWLHESQVELDLILGASQTFRAYDRALLVVNGAVALGTNTLTIECQQIFRLNSLISGSGSLILNGPGQTIMGGGLGNSYTGTTHLNAGTLILSKAHGHAIRFGELIIGDGLGGADADAVWVWETNQIGLIPITIRSSGFLDLYNYDCMVSELTLDGGHASSDLGTLTLRGDVTVLSNADRQALVEGHVVLNATRTFTVANSPFSPDLRVTALVSGPGGLTKTGAGALGLYSANAFTGVTTVNQGLLYTYAAGALGTPAAGTVVSNQGVLVLSGGIQVLGESLTLGGFGDSISGALTAVGGSNSWGGNITLDSDTSIKVLTNCFLNLTGAVSGVAGFTKIGPGTLIFSGENANTYAGDTLVNEGTLLLDKSDTDGAMSGSGQLVVGDGVGGPGADLVQELRSFQIAGSVDVTVNYSGTLDLNDHSDTIGGLTIHGGDVTTGSGTLTLGGDLSGTMVNYTCADIYGRLALGATNRRIHVPELSCLAIVANISGTGFTKLGEGDLYLMNSNSYSGLTTVAEGRVNIRHDFALGSSAIGTVVENGASLYLDSVHVAAEPLSISGHGLYEFGALVASRDGLHSNSWTGPITLTGDTWIRTASSNWVNLAAVISGPGGLLKMSGGTLILSGSGGNTFDGDVVLEAGRLELAKTGGDAIPGPGMLTVGDDFGGVESDVVRYLEADQIATTAPIVVNSSGLLDLNGFNDLIGPLIFNGGRMDTGDGTATLQGNISANASDNAQARILGKLYISGPRNVNVDSSPFSPDLAVWAQIRGNGGLTKNGDGELSLSASNSFNGLTTVNAGTLDADHSFALGTTSNGTVVADGASLAVRYDSRVGNESLTVQGVGSGSGLVPSRSVATRPSKSNGRTTG